jgi:hypothetical protein
VTWEPADRPPPPEDGHDTGFRSGAGASDADSAGGETGLPSTPSTYAAGEESAAEAGGEGTGGDLRGGEESGVAGEPLRGGAAAGDEAALGAAGDGAEAGLGGGADAGSVGDEVVVAGEAGAGGFAGGDRAGVGEDAGLRGGAAAGEEDAAGGAGSAGEAVADGEAGAADVPPEVAWLAAAVAGLDDLVDLPVAEHVARYDAVHRELSAALTSIDEV